MVFTEHDHNVNQILDLYVNHQYHKMFVPVLKITLQI